MRPILEDNLERLVQICQTRQVKKLYTFGSVNTEEFHEESDIDLLVEFETISLEEYADNFFEMCYDLESLFGRTVDLVTIRSVKNPIFKEEIDSTKQLLFDAEKVTVDG